MLSFEPPDLQEKLTKAAKVYVEKFECELSDDLDILEDLYNGSFDPSQYDDIKITLNYLVGIGLPRCDEFSWLHCQEFIDLIEELKEAQLYENKICRSNRRVLIRVKTANEAAVKFLYHAIPDAEDDQDKEVRKKIINLREEISILLEECGGLDKGNLIRDGIFKELSSKRKYEKELTQKIQKSTERFCIHQFVSNGVNICCSLTRGFSIFGILVAYINEYDKYFPPILDEDLFVEIRFDQKISESLEQNVLEAYLFELNSSLDLSIEVSPRPYLNDVWLVGQNDYVFQDPRLRPLILGKGMTELLRLYNKAVSSEDLDIRILYFTKAIEYVSQTVIKIQSNEAIRSKLLSQRALNPDADFISELECVFETQRNYKKDREAIRQTIVTCCEASELAKIAPAFIREFKRISIESSLQDKTKALEALGKNLYSTRNEIAHAKANYQPTGEECPKDQLLDFTKCVQVATQQVIRWYYFSPESIRLT